MERSRNRDSLTPLARSEAETTEAAMICQFCKLNVENPCHDIQEMQQRAANHIDHCEHALKSHQATAGGVRGVPDRK
jgi:hypothetical protein